MCAVCSLFFFSKQKTADERRISDRSSDVCSSDLATDRAWPGMILTDLRVHGAGPDGAGLGRRWPVTILRQIGLGVGGELGAASRTTEIIIFPLMRDMMRGDSRIDHRSEEHTSELQSLMHNAYADFCLKKRTKK